MERIRHLVQIHSNRINDESVIFEKIKTPENRYHFIPSLEGINELYALHAMYIERDFNKAKACYYKAARVNEYMTLTYQWNISSVGIYKMVDALLSDDPFIIKRYSTIKNVQQDETNIGYQIFNAAQNVILDDLDKLDKNIHYIERF